MIINHINKIMREILFKAKRVDNGEWVQGNYNIMVVDVEYTMIQEILRNKDNCIGHIKQYKVIPETVCQFTGFIDKSGNKIFEGDWLNVAPGYNSIIEFKNGAFLSIYTHPEDGEELLMEDVSPNKCDIISNIHE